MAVKRGFIAFQKSVQGSVPFSFFLNSLGNFPGGRPSEFGVGPSFGVLFLPPLGDTS